MLERSKYVRFLGLTMFYFFILFSTSAFSGKHPYQELTKKISIDVIDILIRHGMPVYHDRENHWFKIAAGTDSLIGGNPLYEVNLYETRKIPFEAQVDVVQYCMKLHENRGRQETIKIKMRIEPFAPEFFEDKPCFDLTLNIVK